MGFERELTKLANERLGLRLRMAGLPERIEQAPESEAKSLREQEEQLILALGENADQIRTLVDTNLGDSDMDFDQRLVKS